MCVGGGGRVGPGLVGAVLPVLTGRAFGNWSPFVGVFLRSCLV